MARIGASKNDGRSDRSKRPSRSVVKEESQACWIADSFQSAPFCRTNVHNSVVSVA